MTHQNHQTIPKKGVSPQNWLQGKERKQFYEGHTENRQGLSKNSFFFFEREIVVFCIKISHQIQMKGAGGRCYTGTASGQPQSCLTLSHAGLVRVPAIPKSRVNSERGQWWKAQQDSQRRVSRGHEKAKIHGIEKILHTHTHKARKSRWLFFFF